MVVLLPGQTGGLELGGGALELAGTLTCDDETTTGGFDDGTITTLELCTIGGFELGGGTGVEDVGEGIATTELEAPAAGVDEAATDFAPGPAVIWRAPQTPLA